MKCRDALRTFLVTYLISRWVRRWVSEGLNRSSSRCVKTMVGGVDGSSISSSRWRILQWANKNSQTVEKAPRTGITDTPLNLNVIGRCWSAPNFPGFRGCIHYIMSSWAAYHVIWFWWLLIHCIPFAKSVHKVGKDDDDVNNNDSKGKEKKKSIQEEQKLTWLPVYVGVSCLFLQTQLWYHGYVDTSKWWTPPSSRYPEPCAP